jgi:hypothetical protein
MRLNAIIGNDQSYQTGPRRAFEGKNLTRRRGDRGEELSFFGGRACSPKKREFRGFLRVLCVSA